MPGNNDSQLISDYLKGDEQALEVLIARHSGSIYIFICRIVNDAESAKDLVQETFIKVWKNLKKFKQQGNFKAWIFRIAQNTAIDYLRQNKELAFSEFENEQGENALEDNIADPRPLPDEIFERNDFNNQAAAAIANLPLAYRQVLFLHYNDHFTLQEIAGILNKPLNTVKSRHRRGIILLRQALIE